MRTLASRYIAIAAAAVASELIIRLAPMAVDVLRAAADSIERRMPRAAR